MTRRLSWPSANTLICCLKTFDEASVSIGVATFAAMVRLLRGVTLEPLLIEFERALAELTFSMRVRPVEVSMVRLAP